MAKVTLLNVNTETAQSILNKTNVPYYGYVNINTNLQIPTRIKYNHTYYKLIGNELVAFRVLAQALGKNGVSQLIQTTDGNISWKLNYWGFCGYDAKEGHKIFASVEDYIKYLETNDYKLIANNNHCTCFCESIFNDFEGRVYDRFRDSIYCKHTFYMRNGVVINDKSLIEYILFNEQGVFLFLDHCEGFESREKAVNSLLNNVVVTDFKETTINLNIEIKETSEQKYKIQLL
jgi:hypothetical protein